MRYDDKSPDPMLWSSARVSKWLREYKGGKYAVLLKDNLFKNLDGEGVCMLPAAEFPCIARSVLFAYMCTQQAFQQLSSAYTDGEQSWFLHSCSVPRLVWCCGRGFTLGFVTSSPCSCFNFQVLGAAPVGVA